MSIKKFGDYINIYKSFASELKDAIEDENYKANGGKLFFAVDFSEIFAYILPAGSYKNFFMFDHGIGDGMDEIDAQALHQLLLKHIFFESTDWLLLLPPYVLELQTFIQKMQTDALDELMQIAADFLEEVGSRLYLELLEDSPVGKILKKYDIEDYKSLTRAEENQIVGFIQRYGHILALSDGIFTNHSALTRLREFIKQGRFKTLQAFTQENHLPSSFTQSDIYPRWNVELINKRGEERSAAAKLDAVAIDIIGQINQEFQQRDEKNRLLIFTRSYHMREIFREEFERGEWDKFGQYPLLRHPRVQSVLSILASVKTLCKGITQIAEEQLTPVNAFLEAVPQDVLEDDPIPENFLPMVRQIQAKWEQTQALVLSHRRADQGNGGQGAYVEQARNIFTLLRSENIQQRITDRLEILLQDIDFMYDFLALDLQQENPSPAVCFMPYSLRFSSREARKLVEPFVTGQEYKFQQIVRALLFAFSDKTGEQSSYEMRLAASYILALIGRWELADKICDQAISIGIKNRRPQPVHEGNLLRALCKRKLAVDFSAIPKRDWDDIERALAVFPDDPRFVFEKGALLLSINLSCHDSAFPKEGLGLLTDVERNLHLPNDAKLLVEIAAIRMHYLLSTNQIQHSDWWKAEFQKLLQVQTQIEVDETLWPVLILDTLAWAEWALYYEEAKADPVRRDKIIERLKNAMRSQEISTRTRKTVQDHIDAVSQNEKINF